MSFTKEDIKTLREVIREETNPRFAAIRAVIREEMKPGFDSIRQEFNEKFDRLQTSVDGFLVLSRTTEQEHLLLRAQFTKLRSVLIQKQVLSEQDLTS